MIRAFVGLELPGILVDRLEAVQAGLPAGRAVAPESMHLTLAFLGEQPAPVLEDLHLALLEVRGPAVSLSVTGIGVFGGARPRNLHAVVAPDPELSALRKRVATAAREAGIAVPAERFVPHVTLARFPQRMPVEDYEALHRFLAKRMALTAGPFEIDAFTLFRSHLRADGAAYESLADYPLSG